MQEGSRELCRSPDLTGYDSEDDGEGVPTDGPIVLPSHQVKEKGMELENHHVGQLEENRIEVKAPDATAPVKFAFTSSKPKFSASRPPRFPKGKQRSSDDESKDNMEYVTGFDEQGIVAKDPKGRIGARVIPKLENSWRPEKRMKNIMMETDILDNTNLRFEKEIETSLEGANSGARYGLTMGFKMMETSETTTTVTNEKDQNGQRTRQTTVVETHMEQMTKLSFSEIEDQRLKQDLTLLPDEADLDAYEDMPVEDFGEAMLRGMGWEKGKPIGRSSKDVVVPVEYVRRSGRTGLGAEAAPKEVSTKKYIKPGESRSPAPELVAALGPDGRSRNVISLDEKLVERTRKGVARGKVMSVISGRHLGLRGEVLDVLDSDRVLVKLVKSEEKVVVNAAELADIGSLEEEKVLKQIRQLKIGNGEGSQDIPLAEDSPSDRRGDKKYDRNANRREGDGRRDDDRAHYRLEDEEQLRSRRDSRRDGRADCEDQKRSSREGRHDLKRDETERAGDEMEVDDERTRRSEDRRKSSRHHKREERRDEGRRDSRRDGRRDEERSKSRSYRERDNNADRERAGRDRRDEVRPSQDRAQKDQSNSADRDSSGVPIGGRIPQPWLMSQIRVRVISKTLKGGRLYLKKGRIVDVISPKECDILMDESGEMVQGVKQDQLETALPRKGGRIVVVGGTEYRGKLGKLLDRGSEKGVVQMEENFHIETMDLDLLAEYIGDSSEVED